MHLRIIVIITALVSLTAAAEQPQLTGATVSERSAKAGLQQAMQEIVKTDKSSFWIGYSVPAIPGEHHICCYNWGARSAGSCCGSCRLDGRDHGVTTGNQASTCRATLASTFFVFLRFESGSMRQVRTYSPDCGIEAAGSTIYWLQDVEPAQSVAYLESQLNSGSTGGSDEIITAIALHDGTQANATLEKLVQPGYPSHVRSQAAFWIGSSRGAHGLGILLKLIQSDQDNQFLEQAIFAISQSEDHERAFSELIRLARNDSRHEVREHALFWLAQEAGQKAAGTITDAIENDPDTDVKKKAVFALSEMPKQEGIPLLIEQARKNRNPVVRKEAIFWLGQTDDPRALDYIASILEH